MAVQAVQALPVAPQPPLSHGIKQLVDNRLLSKLNFQAQNCANRPVD